MSTASHGMKTKAPSYPILLVLLALLAAPVSGPAAEVPVEAWERRYSSVSISGIAFDRAVAVVADVHGNIIVAGSSETDTIIIKYSATDGSMLWTARTRGYPTALAEDGSGNVVVAVQYHYGDNNAHIAKYAGTDGALLWEGRGPVGRAVLAVDAGGNVVVAGSSTLKLGADDGAPMWEQHRTNAYTTAITIDTGRNVVGVGTSYNGNNNDFYTAKYAADGVLLWEQRYNGPGNSHDAPTAVAVDANGNVLVTGTSRNSDFSNDYYTVKYAAVDGMLLWEQRYSGSGPPTALALDASGNVVVTGTYTVKYDALDGFPLWEQQCCHGLTMAVAIDASGNAVVTGILANAAGNNDSYTAKYAAESGTLIWERLRKDCVAEAIALDASGNVAVTGSSIGTNNFTYHFTYDFFTAKYAATDGTLQWEQGYDGLVVKGDDRPISVATDAVGNVVVTGTSSYSIYAGSDWYTAKYRATDGSLIWEQPYNGPADRDDVATAVAVDASGNVVVAGYSDSGSHGSSNFDYYTAKYSAADGALLWEQRYDGSAHSDDQVTALGLDPSGNVVVTGSSIGIGSDWDYYTVKYAAADGAMLWERRYNGPANREDKASDLAIDASGNVLVTGYSFNTQEFWSSDFYTVKYAAEDGTVLWERRYNGPAQVRDRAQVVAVDANGDVVVAGQSDYSYVCEQDWGCFESGRWYIAKYAGADGALLWERRPEGMLEFPLVDTVATDSLGNVIVSGLSVVIAKYADADGALLWERPGLGALVVDAEDNVVVAGSGYDVAKYAATDGALLWGMPYSSPDNADHAPTALALAPDGSIIVTGISGGDFATVKYVTYSTPVVLSLDLSPDGARLCFAGDAGRTYRLQRASNPAGPWTTSTVLTAPPDGAVEHLDPAPLASPAFYRIAAP